MSENSKSSNTSFGTKPSTGALDATVTSVHDIDQLAQAIRDGGAKRELFDVNVDHILDSRDLDFWVSDLFGTWTGDVNLDGEFNSNDLVSIFQSGKYESGATALWSEGDWKGDGLFTTRDLVAAFRTAVTNRARVRLRRRCRSRLRVGSCRVHVV